MDQVQEWLLAVSAEQARADERNVMNLPVELDYLVIGHVTRDLVGAGKFHIGGTVSYAARTALALGYRVGVVTSASLDLDLDQVLDGILVARSQAPATTTFENIYTAQGRTQVLHSTAGSLHIEMIPADWRTRIVHLGPVAQECPRELLALSRDVFVGVTPQGWMRCWDEGGRVMLCPWPDPEAVLARADAVVLSETDVVDPSLIDQYAGQTRLLIVTRGPAGCSVYTEGSVRDFPAPPAQEVDPTGAGDIFAAAFFLWMERHRDPWGAARFANCIASHSVTRVGVTGAPTLEEAAGCRQAMRSKR